MSFNLSGRWQINDGSSKYDVDITQRDRHVHGQYGIPGGHGDIDGFIQGNIFDFSWQQTNGKAGRGLLTIEADGNTMSGTWRRDNEDVLHNWVFSRYVVTSDFALFRDQMRQRFQTYPYTTFTEISAPQPLQLAVRSEGVGPHFGTGVHIYAFVDARVGTPSVIFARVNQWFVNSVGTKGAGVLVFAYPSPTENLRTEIQRNFKAGNIDIYGGLYDLVDNRHWLNAWFDAEHHIFGT